MRMTFAYCDINTTQRNGTDQRLSVGHDCRSRRRYPNFYASYLFTLLIENQEHPSND